MNSITRLYPQFQYHRDRRQNNIPVAIDRRSGADRRGNDRVVLDSNLTKDIYDVKSKVSKIENLAPKLFINSVENNAPTFMSMNNMTQDTFVKQSRPDEKAREEIKAQDRASLGFQVGVIGFAIAAAIGLSYLSSAGVVTAIGTALYLGARVLKVLIMNQIKSDSEKNVKTKE